MFVLSETALLLFVQTVPAALRADLRWEFINIAAAIALLSIALVALALFFYRRQTRDLTLIYFSLFCSMYAVRLLADMRFFRSLFEGPRTFWELLNWIITCTILVPFAFFFYHLASAYLRRCFRWVLAAQIIFAVFGVFAAALGFNLAKLHIANNIVVLTTCVVTCSSCSGTAGGRGRNALPTMKCGFSARVLSFGFCLSRRRILGACSVCRVTIGSFWAS
jgi:hypothetical protein